MNARITMPRTAGDLISALKEAPAGGIVVYSHETAGPLGKLAAALAAAGMCTTHIRRPSADGVRAPEIQYIVMRTKRAWDDARVEKVTAVKRRVRRASR